MRKIVVVALAALFALLLVHHPSIHTQLRTTSSSTPTTLGYQGPSSPSFAAVVNHAIEMDAIARWNEAVSHPSPPQKINHRQPATTNVVYSDSGGLPAGLVCIRQRESGGNYAINTGNGYSGAFQYSRSTWNNYGGYAYAYQAPPSVQDERATADYNLGSAHRHQEWPQTSRACGV